MHHHQVVRLYTARTKPMKGVPSTATLSLCTSTKTERSEGTVYNWQIPGKYFTGE